MSHPFHRLTAPETWAVAVDAVSYSALRTLEQCPRQWQLRRSSWPGFERFPTRPHAASLEGTLVHEMLDRIFRALSFAGLPAPGSEGFRRTLREVDLMGAVQRGIDEANAQLLGHPRRAALRLPHDARWFYNRVAQLFQREYASVERAGTDPVLASHGGGGGGESDGLKRLRVQGVLTEWSVAHPSLPVRGVVDMLRLGPGGTWVVDFKTGHPRPEYEEQLQLYALLWWRSTGDLPVSLSLRHPRGNTVFAVDAARLEALEGRLAARIGAVRAAVVQTPAPARTGEHCTWCDARPFCDEYWRALPPVTAQRGAGSRWGDVEVQGPGEIGAHGFVASQGARRLPVVWDDDGAAVHGPFVAGETLRILGAQLQEDAVRLTAMTEVFHRGDGIGAP